MDGPFLASCALLRQATNPKSEEAIHMNSTSPVSLWPIFRIRLTSSIINIVSKRYKFIQFQYTITRYLASPRCPSTSTVRLTSWYSSARQCVSGRLASHTWPATISRNLPQGQAALCSQPFRDIYESLECEDVLTFSGAGVAPHHIRNREHGGYVQ